MKAHVSQSEDGEIGISWGSRNSRFEIMIDPDGSFVWLAMHGGEITDKGEVAPKDTKALGTAFCALSSYLETDGSK